MKKTMLKMLLALLTVSALRVHAELELASDGKTQYTIVYSENEREAAFELKEHLDAITGADFAIRPDQDGKAVSGPAIYVGQTGFCRKQEIDVDKLNREEWLVRNYDRDIVVTGGIPRGTLFGVYELLEKKFGCRWLAYDTTIIPKQKTLKLSELDLRGEPSFFSRELWDDFPKAKSLGREVFDRTLKFRKRIRSSLNYGNQAYWPDKSLQFYNTHTFYFFVDPNVYFTAHPEYFSMNAEGKRCRGTVGANQWQGANLCLTNPDVVNIAWEKLQEYIAKDRQNLPREKWPLEYPISQMDAVDYLCLCPECRKITEREGSESGLLIHFLNQLGERLEKKYPELRITSLAYVSTRYAPKYIKPRKNVLLSWTNLYTVNDCYRPITSKFNAGQLEEYTAWCKRGIPLAVYEYWNMGDRYFDPPRVETCIDAIIVNLPFFYRNGCRSYFAQFNPDYDRLYAQNFAHLQCYVAYQLLKDIDQDPEKLIREFMTGYYGPAEKPMSEFLRILRDAVKNERCRMRAFERVRPYCTESFMRKVWSLLEEARDLTEPGSIYRRHVEQEMLSPVYVILKNHWPIGDHDKMLEFYKAERMRRINSVNGSDKIKKTKLDRLNGDLCAFIEVDLKVPDRFREKEVIMLGWPYLRWNRGHNIDAYENDAEAAGGRALITKKEDAPWHDMKQTGRKGFTPLDFGMYDMGTKKGLHKHFQDEIPLDEKYHWYKLGSFDLGQHSFVWGFYWYTRCDLSNYYRVADGIRDANVWDIWVSAKFTGPAYVPGSQKKNEVYWDQVMLVREKTNSAEE